MHNLMDIGYQKIVRSMLSEVGAEVNGPKRWDPRIHDGAVYERVSQGGVLALGESFMDGQWDVDELDVLVTKIWGNGMQSTTPRPSRRGMLGA